MALLINKAKPAGGDLPSTLDNEQRTLRTAIQDIFGILDNTTISNAAMSFTSGGLATINLSAASATAGTVFDVAAGHAQRDLVTSVGMGINVQADTWDVNASGNGETVAIGALAFLGIPTWTSTGTSYTVTAAATLYVQGAPVGSTNVTTTNTYAIWSDAGDIRLDGDNTTGVFLIDASQDAVSLGGANVDGAALTLNNLTGRTHITSVGTQFHIPAQTSNFDNGSETIAVGSAAFIGIPTWTGDTATLTITDAATLYIEGAPVDSTNVTATNAYALLVAAGTVKVGGGQIEFPSTQVASSNANTLDDYEEGTWTPQIADNNLDGSGEGQVYVTQDGTYTKIGNTVFFRLLLSTSSIGTLTGGNVASIVGLPFTVSSQDSAAVAANGTGFAVPDQSAVCGFIQASGTRIALQHWSATTGIASMTITEWSANGLIAMAGQYDI